MERLGHVSHRETETVAERDRGLRLFLVRTNALPDLLLQFTGDAFEFPRSDMPSNVQFVGPALPNKSASFKEPARFAELDGSKPVVLVTQGTLANFDLRELVQPALTALADDNALVIAAAGASIQGT